MHGSANSLGDDISVEVLWISSGGPYAVSIDPSSGWQCKDALADVFIVLCTFGDPHGVARSSTGANELCCTSWGMFSLCSPVSIRACKVSRVGGTVWEGSEHDLYDG